MAFLKTGPSYLKREWILKDLIQTINKNEDSLLLERKFYEHWSATKWKAALNGVKITERPSLFTKCSRGRVIFPKLC